MRRRVREEEEVGELNIVPYLDIVTNLVMFMLLSIAGLISLGVLDVDTPKLGTPDPVQMAQQNPLEPQLNLTVAISDQGFYIAGAGGVLEGPADAQSVDTKSPPTVPNRDGKYDYAGLTEKMAMIKEKFPTELKIILVAEMTIPYEIIIQTMDACREKLLPGTQGIPEHKTLFPQVWLSSLR